MRFKRRKRKKKEQAVGALREGGKQEIAVPSPEEKSKSEASKAKHLRRNPFVFFRLLNPKRIREAALAEFGKKEIEKWLVRLIILLLLWLTVEVAMPVRFSSEERLALADSSGSLVKREATPLFTKYAKVFEKRKLFKPALRLAGDGVAMIGVEKMAENLSLIGIISSGDKLQAFINDKSSGTTTLCNEGDTFAGFKVVSITKEKVILQYRDFNFELIR